MADSFSNIRADGVQKVPNAAARLALLPPDGYLVEQLDTNVLYAYNQASNTWKTIGGGTGTVTSVGLSLPASLFNVSGTPVTSSGTLTGTLKSQNQNTVFASPNGAPGTPSFRSLVVDDIPPLPASQIPQATTSSDGYLSSTDWNTFNSKQAALGYTPANAAGQVFTGAISAPNLSGTNTGDVTLGTANGLSLVGQALSLGTSSTSTTGALTDTDWNTFNGKQNALTPGSASTSTTGVTVTGTNATVGPAITVDVQTASDSQPGLLSATDWNTFNEKLNLTGGTLTGPLVLFGDGTTGNEAVTYNQFAGALSGLTPLPPTVASPTVNVSSLSGPITADGIVITTGQAILLQNQTNPVENGIWVVDTGGAWARRADMAVSDNAYPDLVPVSQGATYGNRIFLQTSNPAIVGTNGLVFAFFAASVYTASGTGLVLIGNQFAVQIDGTTLSQSGSGLKVASGGVTNAEVAALAAIARSKLATDTASRAVVNDGSGNLSVSATTSTEIGYVNGVTSAIQTQLNSKFATAGGTFTGAVAEAVSALSYGATINTNATLANLFTVTLTGATAQLANPTGAVNGQTLIFRITQDGSGNRLLTFDSAFKFGTLIPSITLSTAAGATDYIGVKYNGASGNFDVVSFNGGF